MPEDSETRVNKGEKINYTLAVKVLGLSQGFQNCP